jgi:ERCC4-type nuclease
MTGMTETETETLPALPALRSLGDLADVRPVVVVDSREQLPLPITRLRCETRGLDTGDYSYTGAETAFAVERKTVQDFVGCCAGVCRERFERELARLRGFRFKRLLIIGSESEIQTGRYRSGISPASVLGTLAAFEVRYDIPVVWRLTPEAAARQVESWVWWHARETVKAANALLECGAE